MRKKNQSKNSYRTKFKIKFIKPLTSEDDLVKSSARFGESAVKKALDAATVVSLPGGRHNKALVDRVLNAPKRKALYKTRWGKVAHDVLIPTRIVAGGLAATRFQMKKIDVAIDKQNYSGKKKIAAKIFVRAPLFGVRKIFAASEVLLRSTDLVTTPVAMGMSGAVKEIRQRMKKHTSLNPASSTVVSSRTTTHKRGKKSSSGQTR